MACFTESGGLDFQNVGRGSGGLRRRRHDEVHPASHRPRHVSGSTFPLSAFAGAARTSVLVMATKATTARMIFPILI